MSHIVILDLTSTQKLRLKKLLLDDAIVVSFDNRSLIFHAFYLMLQICL